MKEMIKKWIIKLFGIETHEKELVSLSEKYAELEQFYNLRADTIKSYQNDVEIMKAELESLKEIYADPMAKIKTLTDEIDRVAHKSYAIGRKDAYTEMGIIALDARIDGNVICVDADNKIVEIVQVPSLEDVCAEDGIDINDLVNVTAEEENDAE